MTAPSQPTEPRGAGSGEKATASRSRSIIDWPPEPVAHEDAVDALEKKAQDAADYNAEMNRLQTDVAKRVQELVGHPQGEEDDEKAREDAKEAFLAENDPAKKKAALKGAMDARAKREKAAAE